MYINTQGLSNKYFSNTPYFNTSNSDISSSFYQMFNTMSNNNSFSSSNNTILGASSTQTYPLEMSKFYNQQQNTSLNFVTHNTPDITIGSSNPISEESTNEYEIKDNQIMSPNSQESEEDTMSKVSQNDSMQSQDTHTSHGTKEEESKTPHTPVHTDAGKEGGKHASKNSFSLDTVSSHTSRMHEGSVEDKNNNHANKDLVVANHPEEETLAHSTMAIDDHTHENLENTITKKRKNNNGNPKVSQFAHTQEHSSKINNNTSLHNPSHGNAKNAMTEEGEINKNVGLASENNTLKTAASHEQMHEHINNTMTETSSRIVADNKKHHLNHTQDGDSIRDEIISNNYEDSELDIFQDVRNPRELLLNKTLDRYAQDTKQIYQYLKNKGNDEIIHQAKLVLNNKKGEIKISLNPKEFGTVKMDFIIEDSKIIGKITVGSDEVKEAMQRNMDNLAKQFQHAGFEVKDFFVSVNSNTSDKNNDGQTARKQQYDSSNTNIDTQTLTYSDMQYDVLGSSLQINFVA